MRPVMPILATLVLVAACGTPQEQCIRQGTRNIQVLDRLIAESRATLDRGYAIEQVQVDNWVWVVCGPPRMVEGKPVGGPERCFRNVPEMQSRPVGVNLNDERAKLASMEAKRRELDRAAAPLVADCKARFPQ